MTSFTMPPTPNPPPVLLPTMADQMAMPLPPPPPPPPPIADLEATAAVAPQPERKRGAKRRRAPFETSLEEVATDKTPREMTPEEKSLIGRIYLAFKKNGYATRDFDALLKAIGYEVNQATYIHWARVLEERGEAVSTHKKKRARTIRSSPYALRLSFALFSCFLTVAVFFTCFFLNSSLNERTNDNIAQHSTPLYNFSHLLFHTPNTRNPQNERRRTPL